MTQNYKMSVRHLNFYYGRAQALYDISLDIKKSQVTALIGPSGCGKSTFIRCLNRMNDLIPASRVEGEIILDNFNINDPSLDVVMLRRRQKKRHAGAAAHHITSFTIEKNDLFVICPAAMHRYTLKLKSDASNVRFVKK